MIMCKNSPTVVTATFFTIEVIVVIGTNEEFFTSSIIACTCSSKINHRCFLSLYLAILAKR